MTPPNLISIPTAPLVSNRVADEGSAPVGEEIYDKS